MSTHKARMAALAVIRKLPPDEILRREYYVERLTFQEIARRHGVSRSCVPQMWRMRGWTKERPDIVDAPATSPAPELCETREKIIIRREALVKKGRDLIVSSIAISLPRIPTLHGHFAESLSSVQGAPA